MENNQIEPYKMERREWSINERIAQEAADSWDQAARAVFVFLRCEHCRVFRCLPQINVSPLNNNENLAAGINWAGCGPSSPGQISSPDINFFQAENG